MKRILLAALCLLALLLAGCTAVNQTNSFVALPTASVPEATAAPVVTIVPEVTVIPEITVTPETSQPQVVPLNVKPAPQETEGAAPVSPSPEPPEESPGAGGFNG